MDGNRAFPTLYRHKERKRCVLSEEPCSPRDCRPNRFSFVTGCTRTRATSATRPAAEHERGQRWRGGGVVRQWTGQAPMSALAKRPEQFVTRQRTEANSGGHGQQVKAERSGYAGHTGLAQQGFSVASVNWFCPGSTTPERKLRANWHRPDWAGEKGATLT